jgi:S-adenosylmethionine-diacylglycerol 3-amino-3-carboxypropyl transferase
MDARQPTARWLPASPAGNYLTADTGLAQLGELIRPQWVQTEEDVATTVAALGSAVSGELLCIASGGCTPLALVAAGAGRVLAVDVHPAQLAVARCKALSVERLRYRELKQFWLDPDSTARWDVFGRVADGLADWQRSILTAWLAGASDAPLVDQGSRQGVGTELLIHDPDLWRRARMWFQCRDIDRQRCYYRTKLAGLAETLADIRQKRAAQTVGAGLRELSYEEVAVAMRAQFLTRFGHLVERIPVAGNAYAAHLVLGRYPADARPNYLTADGQRRLRPRIDRVAFVLGDVGDVVSGIGNARLDGADLSNVLDLMSDEQAQMLLASMARVVRPGGRLVHRTLIRDEPLPAGRGFFRSRVTARRLSEADRSFVYSAVVVDVRTVGR